MAIEQKIPTPSEVKSAPVSFSQEELSEIRDLRTELNQITFQLGQIKINKIEIGFYLWYHFNVMISIY